MLWKCKTISFQAHSSSKLTPYRVLTFRKYIFLFKCGPLSGNIFSDHLLWSIFNYKFFTQLQENGLYDPDGPALLWVFPSLKPIKGTSVIINQQYSKKYPQYFGLCRIGPRWILNSGYLKLSLHFSLLYQLCHLSWFYFSKLLFLSTIILKKQLVNGSTMIRVSLIEYFPLKNFKF